MNSQSGYCSAAATAAADLPSRFNGIPLTAEQSALLERAKAYLFDQARIIELGSERQPSTGPPSPRTSSHPPPSQQPQQPQQQQQPKQQKLAPHLTGPNTPPAIAAGVDPRVYTALCRIYVGQVAYTLNEQQLRALFSQFGPPVSVHLATSTSDNQQSHQQQSSSSSSAQHRGYAFVEYEVPEAADLAIQHMNGQTIAGRALKVGRTKKYDEVMHSSHSQLPEPSTSRIYISNVHENLTEEQLREIVQPFGEVEQCILLPDLTSTAGADERNRGYGFVEYKEQNTASQIASVLNGMPLGGLSLKATPAVIGGPLGVGMNELTMLSNKHTASDDGSDGDGGDSGSRIALPEEAVRALDAINRQLGVSQAVNHEPVSPSRPVHPAAHSSTPSEMNAIAESLIQAPAQHHSKRHELMQKLAASQPQPSRDHCVVRIANSVDVGDVDDMLADDFEQECTKYGKVAQVKVRIERQQRGTEADVAMVYVEFASAGEANAALAKLDGRWFAKRRLSATLVDSIPN
ncbi:RNA-binding domain-containing protein [Ramicandelaber brevisporus]|nr:RNA-binding domain-containing protein [Ramicandelaber brevisporus]